MKETIERFLEDIKKINKEIEAFDYEGYVSQIHWERMIEKELRLLLDAVELMLKLWKEMIENEKN